MLSEHSSFSGEPQHLSFSESAGEPVDLTVASLRPNSQSSEGQSSYHEKVSPTASSISEDSTLITASSLAGGYSQRDQRFRLTGEYCPTSFSQVACEFEKGLVLHPDSFRSCARILVKDTSLLDLAKDLEIHNASQVAGLPPLSIEYYYRNLKGDLIVGVGVNADKRSEGVGALLSTHFELNNLHQKVMIKPIHFPDGLSTTLDIASLTAEQRNELVNLFQATFGQQWTDVALTELQTQQVPLCVALDAQGQVAAAAIAEVDELTSTIEFTEWVSIGKPGAGARVLVDLMSHLRQSHKEYLVYGEFNVQRAAQVALRLGFTPAAQEHGAFAEMIIPHNVKVNNQFTNFAVLVFDEKRPEFPRGLYP
jgi:hypothetical protein